MLNGEYLYSISKIVFSEVAEYRDEERYANVDKQTVEYGYRNHFTARGTHDCGQSNID